uniref:Protein FAM92B-like n=1 Tax=Kryptolebias marmoratus TaxID=37003 RepID=A0A3Q2ZR24_KRYMA
MSFSWLHCWLCFRRDAQVQSMEQTLKHAEKNLGEICSILASYTRKTAKLRDKADLLVAQLFDFSTTEGPEFQVGLKNLAEDLAMVQDYRQAQVERLETRVVAPLKAYGDIIKNKKVSLLKATTIKFSADLNREQKELQKLEKVRQRSPADRQTIVSFIDAVHTGIICVTNLKTIKGQYQQYF